MKYEIGNKIIYIHHGHYIHGIIYHVYKNSQKYLIKVNPMSSSKFIIPESSIIKRINCGN